MAIALGRIFRAERELRADDRRKRYDISDEELAMEIALKIPGDDRLSAIVIAAGMLRQIRTINDGGTPVADAMDAIMEDSLTC
ncbi:hypothetical protein [Pseudomonas faucium]|uniref:hypothetical protein n=1 Tax=Pseudomonas faucium TaxID=2740518 RepID=UPI001596E8BE|nr:hypothetical protein [Pseudomonas faucium]